MKNKKQYVIKIVLETQNLDRHVEDSAAHVLATFIDKGRAEKFISSVLSTRYDSQ